MTTTPTNLPNGYFVLPPGRLANAVIWLEMRAPPATPLAAPLSLVAAKPDNSAACARLFAEVGTPWLWSRAARAAEASHATTFVALDDDRRRIGIFELSGLSENIEIVFFGLIPTATGKGLGRRMMAAALDLAWRTADRVWLHTCNFDHPAALRFYQSCGFVPYASGFELLDDPRLDGSLQINAAPQIPLIEPVGR